MKKKTEAKREPMQQVETPAAKPAKKRGRKPAVVDPPAAAVNGSES